MRLLQVFFGLIILAIFSGLVSCAGDTDDAPFDASGPRIGVMTSVITPFDTLDYQGDRDLAVETLDLVTFDVTIEAEGGFASYSIFLSVDGAVSDTLTELYIEDLNPSNSNTLVEDSRNFEIPSELVNTTATFTFVATDQLGQTSEVEVDLEVHSPRARQYSAILLAAPLSELNTQNFFNTVSGKALSSQEIVATEGLAERVDFGYYFGQTDSASIASPRGFEKTAFLGQVEGWTTLNATVIRSTELENLTEIERFEDIDLVYDQGVDESGIITHLVRNQVVTFETVRGKRGLILVKDIVDLDGDGVYAGTGDYIALDIIVQERTPRQ